MRRLVVVWKYFIEAFLFQDKWVMKKFEKVQNKNYLE